MHGYQANPSENKIWIFEELFYKKGLLLFCKFPCCHTTCRKISYLKTCLFWCKQVITTSCKLVEEKWIVIRESRAAEDANKHVQAGTSGIFGRVSYSLEVFRICKKIIGSVSLSRTGVWSRHWHVLLSLPWRKDG